MKRIIGLSVLFLLIFALPSLGAQGRLFHYPDVSGNLVAFVYAGDIARGIRLALTTKNADTCYNLSTQTEISLNELVTILSRITGKEITPSYGPAREGDIYRSSLSNEKAVKNLHWIPEVSLEEGLKRTYEYFRK